MSLQLRTTGPATQALLLIAVDDDNVTIRDFVTPFRTMFERGGTLTRNTTYGWGGGSATSFQTTSTKWLGFTPFTYSLNATNVYTFVVMGSMPPTTATVSGYMLYGGDDLIDYKLFRLRTDSYGNPPYPYVAAIMGSDRVCPTSVSWTGGEKRTIAFRIPGATAPGSLPYLGYIFADGGGSTPLQSVSIPFSGSSCGGSFQSIGLAVEADGVTPEPSQQSWPGDKFLIGIFQGTLTLTDLQNIHTNPKGTLFTAGGTALINHKMYYDPSLSSNKWSDAAAVTPILTSGSQGVLHHVIAAAGLVNAQQDPTLGLTVTWPTGGTQQVTTAGFTTAAPERYQQVFDARSGGTGYAIGYDDVGGRLIKIRVSGTSGNAAPPVASGISGLPSVAQGTAVALAFDARRRRIVLFFPQGIYYVDLRTNIVTSAGPLPSGVTSFDRAIYHPYSDVILAWADPSDLTKFHKFAFTDTDLSDQPGNLVQGLLWDGDAGTSVTFFNTAAGAAWTNPGGDFTDTTGNPQALGSPYASFQFALNSTTETKSATVTSLVAKWQLSGNTGLLLRQGGTVRLNSRFASSNTPTLSVTTANGTFNCPCIASGDTGGSGPFPNPSFNPSAGSATMTCSGTQKCFLQFDLSGVIGSVTSATLTVTKTFQSDSSSPVLVLLCTPPVIATDNYTPASGTIASNYAYDGYNGSTYAITSHPDVLVFDNMTNGWDGPTRLNLYGTGTGGNWIADGADSYLGGGGYGKYALEYGVGSAFSSTDVISFYRLSIPDQTDVYCRYLLYLEDDWGSVVTGVKMPGWWGQYTNGPGGQQPGVPYPGSGAGNGAGNGSLCKVISNVNTGNVPKFDGWTCRMHFRANSGQGGEPADANPYRKILSFLWSESVSDSGNDTTPHWFSPQSFARRKRWYAIEQHIKMNTINTSTLDQYGNGVGNPDGVIEVWIEDRLVLSLSNLIFSHHPSYKIPGFWLTMQHGGNEDPIANHSFRMANLIIAKSRIGTIKSTPAWLQAAGVGQWLDIPNSTLSSQSLSWMTASGYDDPRTLASPNTNFMFTIGNGQTPRNRFGIVLDKNHAPPFYSFSSTSAWSEQYGGIGGFDPNTGTIYVGGGDSSDPENSYRAFKFGQDAPAWTFNVIQGSSHLDARLFWDKQAATPVFPNLTTPNSGAVILGSSMQSGSSPTAPVTMHQTITAEAPFTAVQIIAVNTHAAAATLTSAIVAVSARQNQASGPGSPATPTGPWTAVTWGGSQSVSVPGYTTVVGNTRTPGFALSDVIQLASIAGDTSDPQNPNGLPIAMFRQFWDTAAGNAPALDNAPSINWTTGIGSTYKRINKNFQFSSATNFATVATAGSASGGVASTAFMVPIFTYANRGFTVMGVGDSTMQGAPSVGLSYDNSWIVQAAMLASTPSSPITAMNASFGGQSMGTYINIAKNIIGAGFVPDACVLQVGSPNDQYQSQAAVDGYWNQAMNFVNYCVSNKIIPILQAPWPFLQSSANDPFWQSLVNRVIGWGNLGYWIVNATTGNLQAASGSAAWAGGVPGVNSQDGTHPTNAAALKMAQAGATTLQALAAFCANADSRRDRYYDGRRVGGHSYWTRAFIPQRNWIVHVESKQYYDVDSGYTQRVQIADLTSGDYQLSQTDTIQPFPDPTSDNVPWHGIDPTTGDIYAWGDRRMWKLTQSTLTWSVLYNFRNIAPFSAGDCYTIGCAINYVDRYILCEGFTGGGNTTRVVFTLDLTQSDPGQNAKYTALNEFTVSGSSGGPVFTFGKIGTMVWNEDWQAFAAYKDSNATIYKVAKTSPTQFDISVYATTGSAPAAGAIANTVGGPVCSKFGYAPKQKGHYLFISNTQPIKFIRTG